MTINLDDCQLWVTGDGQKRRIFYISSNGVWLTYTCTVRTQNNRTILKSESLDTQDFINWINITEAWLAKAYSSAEDVF